MTTHLPQPREIFVHVPPYVPGRRSTSPSVAALAANESPYGPLESVVTAMRSLVPRLNRYPDAAAVELRGRIADRLGVHADEIVLGPGSSGVLQQVLLAMCEPGDEVVLPWRSFEAYPGLVTAAGGTPVLVALTEDGAHDLDAMAAAVTERTKVLIVCTPNNPTGVSLDHDAFASFLAALPTHVLVLVDEAYVDFDTDPIDGLALFHAHENVVLLRTFSKAHGLAAMRVGYLVAREPLARAVHAAGVTFSVGSLAQAAATASLDAVEELQERVSSVVTERERLLAAMRDLGWTVTDSQANFVWLALDDAERLALVDAFDAAEVLVRTYPGGVRVTVGQADEVDRVLAVLREHAPGTER